MRLTVLLILFSSFVQYSAAATTELRRGINVSARFYGRPAKGISAEEVALIANLGFDHVRLSLAPDIFTSSTEKLRFDSGSVATKVLESSIHLILNRNINIILDFHPSSHIQKHLFSNEAGFTEIQLFWIAFAIHFSRLSQNQIFFSLLNEPETRDSAKWLQMQSQIYSALRKNGIHNGIIFSGANGGQLEDLLAIDKPPDNDAIYDFHFYRPGIFTHQGVDYAVSYYKNIRVPYPFGPDNSASILSQITEKRDKVHFQEKYGTDKWDATRIKLLLALAADWAKRKHKKVLCGEFGVYRKMFRPEDRFRWILDVRNELEKINIPWAMWDFDGDFGLFDNNQRIPNPQLINALGLQSVKNK